MRMTQPRINPVNRYGMWYLYRRVPERYAHLETRKYINWSTGIAVSQDPRGVRARQAVNERYTLLLQHWHSQLDGNPSPSPMPYLAAQKRAQDLGLDFKPYHEIADSDLQHLLKRFFIIANAWGKEALSAPPTPAMVADTHAVLGTVPTPTIVDPANTARTMMASQMLDEYERINSAILNQKSQHQLHKARTSRQHNLDLFIQIIGGDKPFSELSRQDAQKYRSHWQQRIEAGEIRINSANRIMRQVTGLYAAVKDYHQIDGPNIFDRIFMRGGVEGKRLAFEPTFIQSHYLAEGAFDDLNEDARRLIYLIIETGLRLSEACALDRRTIILDGPVPHVDIQQFNRATKTKESVRKIPLVGVALLAMRAQPNGFPRYYDNADSASALINKAIDVRNLRPGGKLQTLYSMRHTLVDRLTAVEAPEIIKEDMLGHKHMYGKGSTLEHRQQWLQKIAFKPPSRV